MSRPSLHNEIREIESLLLSQLGIRGRDLGEQLARAGRKLPAARRAELEALDQARIMLGSAKLAPRVDVVALRQTHKELRRWLKSISAADRILGSVLGISASVAFALLVVAGLVITVLVWRGFV